MIRFAHRWPRWSGLPIALLFAPFLAGCGGNIHPVEGEVVWKDGSPARELEGSHVVFDLPEKQTSARGIIQADGTFRLTTTKPNDGALAGDHKVFIIETRKQLGGPDSTAIAPGVMDVRFFDPKTSGLEVSVKPGNNKFTLKVERAQRGRQ